jgi:hypothetical protein
MEKLEEILATLNPAPVSQQYKSHTAQYLAGESSSSCVRRDGPTVKKKVAETVDGMMKDVENSIEGNLSAVVKEQLRATFMAYLIPQIVTAVRTTLLGF